MALNNNQITFCQEYVKNGSNGTKAYMIAYNCDDEESAMASASRLLRNVKVSEYITFLQQKIEDKSIMDAKERMIWLSDVIKGKVKTTSHDSNGNDYENEACISDKIKAIDTLNKMSGEYTQKVEMNSNVSINPYDNLTEEEIKELLKHEPKD